MPGAWGSFGGNLWLKELSRNGHSSIRNTTRFKLSEYLIRPRRTSNQMCRALHLFAPSSFRIRIDSNRPDAAHDVASLLNDAPYSVPPNFFFNHSFFWKFSQLCQQGTLFVLLSL
jgi:hypothetical protein